MDVLQLTETTPEGALMRAELLGYGAAARRGDVLPVCMRLVTLRADAEWTRRLLLTREVGPACPPDVLDRACAFMPDAPEPRLLRAARSIAIGITMTCCSTRAAWLAFARHDLLDAGRLDPMDPTARSMLSWFEGRTPGSRGAPLPSVTG